MARVATLLPASVPAPPDQTRGAAVVIVARDGVVDALRTLRDDVELALDALSDLTAVDYHGREPRFEVVYQLNSLTHHHRLRVKAPVPEDDPTIATAVVTYLNSGDRLFDENVPFWQTWNTCIATDYTF